MSELFNYYISNNSFIKVAKSEMIFSTLESGINVAPGKFIKHSPIYTLYLYYLNRRYGVRNKAVAPVKKVKKLISVGLCLFRTIEYLVSSSKRCTKSLSSQRFLILLNKINVQ
jgi:hypothetical protein